MDFAAIAKVLGFPYLHEVGPGVWEVPSIHTAGRKYRVDLVARTCQCAGFAHRGTCSHLDIARVKAGGRIAPTRAA